MMEMNNFYKMYSHVKLIEGKTHSILYDVQKSKIVYTTEAVNKLIKLFNTYNIKDLQNIFADQKKELFETINFLKQNDLIFECHYDNKDNFVEFNETFFSPEHIKYAVIEYSGEYEIVKLLTNLNELLVKHLEIRIVNCNLDLDKLMKDITLYSEGVVRNIKILIDYQQVIFFEQNINLISPKITELLFFNSKKNKKLNNQGINIIYTVENYNDIKNKNINFKEWFIFNLTYYLESIHFNPYYNKRVCIDSKGEIKNCLKYNVGYGNIVSDNLLKVVNSKDFQKLWFINANKILDIKDHELRYNMFITHKIEPAYEDLYKIIY